MSNIKPLTPRQEFRREKILSAARKLVASQGYDGMVMSDLAEVAEVSPTTLYNLFNTKDELLLEALRGLMVKNYEKVEKLPEDTGWKYLLKVSELGAWLRSSEPEFGVAITDALLRAKPGDPLTKLLFEGVRDDFLSSLKKMRSRRALLDEVDPYHLATILVGNYWSTFILLNKGIEKNKQLILSTKINMLSLLAASSRGEAKQQIEDYLSQIWQSRLEEINND
ncbi:MAG: TetR/AcrR family transcriptional regulator [Candidatus Azotimanducaceae bacterium]|tara:strand:+ start:177 stop:848 length:672 start_codon:yes stop_codon:yes gene_type:complete